MYVQPNHWNAIGNKTIQRVRDYGAERRNGFRGIKVQTALSKLHDDTIQKLDEIWLSDTNTAYYIKRYEGNITIIVKQSIRIDDYES